MSVDTPVAAPMDLDVVDNGAESAPEMTVSDIALCKELQAELDGVNKRVQDLTRRVDAEREQHDKMAATMQETKAAFATVSTEIANSQKALESTVHDRDALQKSVDDLQSQLNDAVHTSTEEEHCMVEEVAKRTLVENTVEQISHALAQKVLELETACQNVDTVKAQIKDAEDRLVDLGKQMQDRESGASAKTALISELENQIAVVQSRRLELAVEAKVARTEKENLDHTKAEQQTELDQLSAFVTATHKQQETNLAAHRETICQLQTQCDAQQQQAIAITEEISKVHNKRAECAGKMALVCGSVEQLQYQMTVCEAAIERTMSETADQDTNLNMQIKQLEVALKRAQPDLNKLVEKEKRLLEHVAVVTEKTHDMAVKLEVETGNAEAANAVLIAMERQRQSLATRLSEAQAKQRTCEKALAYRTAEFGMEAEQREKVVGDLEAKLLAAQSEIADAERTATEHSTITKDLQSQIDAVKQRQVELATTTESTRQQLSVVQNEAQEELNQLATQTDAHSKLTVELAKVTRMHANKVQSLTDAKLQLEKTVSQLEEQLEKSEMRRAEWDLQLHPAQPSPAKPATKGTKAAKPKAAKPKAAKRKAEPVASKNKRGKKNQTGQENVAPVC
eukprot:NODE_222_length_2172_cov_230.892605_g147_i0.p1 GENE.NODE_222_length_2172_cov_230.892605_g147_i0~~NODE_222_length_2172_cov_230.892605_g147_i0.p1  ORF type:complete len:646 (+),score=219.50 NODE_222_length_2172_cov_230.892605_g147_i0:65-1939(+)